MVFCFFFNHRTSIKTGINNSYLATFLILKGSEKWRPQPSWRQTQLKTEKRYGFQMKFQRLLLRRKKITKLFRICPIHSTVLLLSRWSVCFSHEQCILLAQRD